MTSPPLPTREHLLQGADMLVIYRDPVVPPKPAAGQPGTRSDFIPTEPELFIALLADGRFLAFNGHVDLGTGIRTALTQIVAEELDVGVERIHMVLGNPFEVPNQGPTIASATIQISATPLRCAAAQARRHLLALAARRLEMPVEQLHVDDGVVHVLENDASRATDDVTRMLRYESLLAGERIALKVDTEVPTKASRDYRVVGRSTPRVDIPAKASGEFIYVHDVRLPGMLHGRVVRAPYVGHDLGTFVGHGLIEADEASVRDLPGFVALVVEGDFVGVVAEREEQAALAAKRLKVRWRPLPELPDLDDLETALRRQPAKHRPLTQQGDVDAALASASTVLERTYVWPYQLHGSIGPSCSVADYRNGHLTLHSGTQNPHSLRADLAMLLSMDESRIEIQRHEAAGCYGRNCADDVGADAALLSSVVGRPVRVQLDRAQEHGWEPKGTAQLMDVRGGADDNGALCAYDFVTRYPSNDAPTLALLLTGARQPSDIPFQMGDRTSVPPYRYPNLRVACDDVAPIVRASWLRGVSALPNCFAHESFIDELAERAGVDPVEYRLRYLEPRPQGLVRAVAERTRWFDRSRSEQEEGWFEGHGFAYGHYVHSKFPGFGAAYAAWAVTLKVHRESGRIRITRIVVGQDAGLMINPAGVRHQVHGNVIQTLSRTLKEQVSFEKGLPISREWGGYSILRFDEVPPIDVLLLDNANGEPLGVGESASLPGAPAIAAALYDATGARFRQPPFTPERVRNILCANECVTTAV
ncbi:xanthine dehydrogenase family protein molybdopterin-binding subunit [Salinicola corii]|uniref:Xanthine dehydrogenase family protein molybdopterin-binding subunit n=1 Tax=Salinicola corii TaxID=2606937 RepID=A0A640WID4_9GAMM|nr:molybdopterin cofactor-binding domain-containing protein [Salinicola corii]KAA0020374.1 xanthine dehydrogenase family protein molybdopterin-binding subunit [Salinicola corii]